MPKSSSPPPEPSRLVASGVCRFCQQPLIHSFVDLGMSPLCEGLRTVEQFDQPETFYPLHALVCQQCWLVQLNEYVRPDAIFSEYAYFASTSDSWLQHAALYVDGVIDRFQISAENQVIEIASNDGYLLKNFVDRGIPVLGIEPAANVARAAQQQGVECDVSFFGEATARRLRSSGRRADLLIGNNVLAHVPDINDFVSGIRLVLSEDGLITMEFPHLLRLMQRNQFDTVYHEHFSYLSLATVQRIFAHHALRLFDVEELPTHGGSLRIYACHRDSQRFQASGSVDRVTSNEQAYGLEQLPTYRAFQQQVLQTKLSILEFFLAARRAGQSVVGYGAPGKGVTLLHYCGIDSDLLEFTVDRNPYKQGAYLPGTSIKIHKPEQIMERKPDFVFILPWNLRDEIEQQMSGIRDWGGKFVVPIPSLEVF